VAARRRSWVRDPHSAGSAPGGNTAAAGVIAFARACDEIAATASKLAKVERLAAYLGSLDDDDLEAAARFFTGNPFPARDDRSIAIGGRTIVAAAQRVWGLTGAQIGAGYRATGDLGAAIARSFRPPLDMGLFRETLTPAGFKRLLDEAAAASGKAAGKRRQLICERALAACRSADEAKYVIKILTGELRIGLREALVVDAVALAFGHEANEVRRAAMAAGDIGLVALAARRGELARVEIAYGAPIGFMLASPITFGSSYRELRDGSWLVEDKFDGIRAQAHKHGERVRLFSRTLSDVSRAFPEVVAAIAACEGDFILDGELVAERDGRVLPFRYLQPRLQRKDVPETIRGDVPVTFVAFDALALAGRFLLDEPLSERRAALAAHVRPSDEALRLAPWSVLARDAADAPAVGDLFAAARARGNEGLMFKRTDAPYVPGRRGKWWLKLKRELSTLDVVVVGVEWGNGKRAHVLSDYTFAVRGRGGELLTIGKAYSGLTDDEIAELTPWFLAHRIGVLERSRHAMAVEPQIVLEVAFDVIQKSELHDSGYALRFPRIARLRPDKPPSEIDTIDNVERIYAEMLEREGVGR
jgi:DNA ligase-1